MSSEEEKAVKENGESAVGGSCLWRLNLLAGLSSSMGSVEEGEA